MQNVLQTLNEYAGYSTSNVLPAGSWTSVQQQSTDWENKIAALRMSGDEMNAAAAEAELSTILSGTLANLQAGAQRTMSVLTSLASTQPAPAEEDTFSDSGSDDFGATESSFDE